jgi:hypothetical protein
MITHERLIRIGENTMIQPANIKPGEEFTGYNKPAAKA